ncbi:MAG: glycosyltransferase [Propionibacteriaceae bacterium]|jgi:beta-1,4-mannosyltransferase|nr:glycosyltransferase [Propionibacteriaceae bacterium]
MTTSVPVRPLVLTTFAPEPPGHVDNPFTMMLEQAITSVGFDTQRFTWKTAILGSYAIFHVHWPDSLVRGGSTLRSLVKCLMLAVLLLRLDLRKTRVVRTVHNLEPHESLNSAQKLLLRRLDRMTDYRIYLSASSMAEPCGEHASIIKMGRYTEWFADMNPVTMASTVVDKFGPELLFFGMVRPYKGVEDLIEAFAACDFPVQLRVVGKAKDEHYGDQLLQRTAELAHALLDLRFVDDNELWDVIKRADLVVLPFRNITNSGSLILALNAGKRVLMPDSPLAREMVEEFGSEWVCTYSGELAPQVIKGALSHLDDTARFPNGPDMPDRDWAVIGAQHADVYNSLLAGPDSSPTAD